MKQNSRWTQRRWPRTDIVVSFCVVLVCIWGRRSVALGADSASETGRNREGLDQPPHVGGSLLMLAAEKNSSSMWRFISVGLYSGKTSTVLRLKRTEPWQICGFAIVPGGLAALYNGEQYEKWNLVSGEKESSIKLTSSDSDGLLTLDYNPSSNRVEGVCVVFPPLQNFSLTSWCAVEGPNITALQELPIYLLGEVRRDCVSHLDQDTLTFWTPGDLYPNTGYFAGMQRDQVIDWFGRINGSFKYDAYIHDNEMNQSYALVLTDAQTPTTQLVKIIPAKTRTEPEKNPLPKLVHEFQPGLQLAAAGMAAYDQRLHQMYAIMENVTVHDHEGIPNRNSGLASADRFHLVTIDMPIGLVHFQDLILPQDWPAGFSFQSVKLWHGSIMG